MDYADKLENLLLRKIQKAERDLLQLKLDYCRFVFGITHRARVRCNDNVYRVCAVDVDSMERQPDGRFSAPTVMGIPLGDDPKSTPVTLGPDWLLESPLAR
ncbi:hypothetical protein [Marinobacter sp. SS21]|uniref:hypothetical protein n=1 Tax=Marinobacter sp. SS21 TaxID=2979460 RepID=UPI002331171F|nr:hypothetical protein [Marinobacter sp. SS21]MDC0664311.1 hypothetical protein [Marinobacter sp. SS21]